MIMVLQMHYRKEGRQWQWQNWSNCEPNIERKKCQAIYLGSSVVWWKIISNFYDILFLYRHNYTLNNSYMKNKFQFNVAIMTRLLSWLSACKTQWALFVRATGFLFQIKNTFSMGKLISKPKPSPDPVENIWYWLETSLSWHSDINIKTCNQVINQKRPETIVEYEYMHNLRSLLYVLLEASSDVFTFVFIIIQLFWTKAIQEDLVFYSQNFYRCHSRKNDGEKQLSKYLFH